MINVRQLMQTHENCPMVCTSPDDSIYNCLKLMAEANVGAVMIVDETGRMVGIFTERDYARKVILQGRSSPNTPVKEVMTRETVTLHPDQSIEECMQLMTEHHVRHLPVMEDGRLVGMVSMRDVVAMLLSLKDATIEKLQNYIFGHDYNR